MLSLLIPLLTPLLPLTSAQGTTTSCNTTVAPWEVLSLSTFSPSGRPGSSPYCTVNITISDPNDFTLGGFSHFPPSTVNCNIAFVGRDPPWGNTTICKSSDAEDFSVWSFALQEPPVVEGGWSSPTENFDVEFKRLLYYQAGGVGSMVYFRSYEARVHFEVGKNMEGVCGASGVCSWGLKEEARPWAVNQTLVVCN